MKENEYNKYTIKTLNAKETVAEGEKLGKQLLTGDVLCVYGELGVGKTAFTTGIAKGLGVLDNDYITSPTFTVVNEYEGKIPFFHFDVYRVNDPDELFEIGFFEYFSRGGVICIEWADLIEDLLPKERIDISICKIFEEGKEDEREITIIRRENSENTRN